MRQIEPLAKFPLIATDCVEKAQFKLSQELTDLKIMRVADRNNFHLRMNGTKIGRTSLVYNRVGTDIKIQSGQAGDSVIFVFGSNVSSKFVLDKKSVVVSSHRAAIVKPSQQVKVDRPKNSQVIVLRASLAGLQHHFQILIDRHHRGTINFEHSVKLNNGPEIAAKTLVMNLINELGTNELVYKNPELLERYEDMLFTALLHLPHKDRDKLYPKLRSQIAPEIVHRAEEYMRANLNKGITIKELLLICKCSRSVLFASFKNFRGYTPLEFLTEQRLQSTREKLLRQNWGNSVSSIALDCGFIHFGRFSRIYKRRFGESPSETLKRGCKVSA